MSKLDTARLHFTEKIPSPRVPIWMQFSLATMFVLALSITILSYIILQRQRTTSTITLSSLESSASTM